MDELCLHLKSAYDDERSAIRMYAPIHNSLKQQDSIGADKILRIMQDEFGHAAAFKRMGQTLNCDFVGVSNTATPEDAIRNATAANNACDALIEAIRAEQDADEEYSDLENALQEDGRWGWVRTVRNIRNREIFHANVFLSIAELNGCQVPDTLSKKIRSMEPHDEDVSR